MMKRQEPIRIYDVAMTDLMYRDSTLMCPEAGDSRSWPRDLGVVRQEVQETNMLLEMSDLATRAFSIGLFAFASLLFVLSMNLN